MTSPHHVGLSVEPAAGDRRGLVLKLGTSRFACVLVPDAGEVWHLGPVDVLDRWLTALERLAAGGGAVLLPFHFADECTGWLWVGPAPDGLVEVQAGWSELGQYDFDPTTDILAAGCALPDFTPVRNAMILRPLADVVAAVRASRDALARSNAEGMD